MKRNTRQEILDTAKALFNERGFNDVSIGHIADAMGISKGNLTYYFKKKEDIMVALLSVPSERTIPETPESLEALDAFLSDLQQAVRDNRFYFWHHAQLSQLSPEIHQRQIAVYKDNTEKLLQCFGVLQRTGLMRKEVYSQEYNHVADTLLLSSIYWMPFCHLKQEEGCEDDLRYHGWKIIYPILTEKGRVSFCQTVGGL